MQPLRMAGGARATRSITGIVLSGAVLWGVCLVDSAPSEAARKRSTTRQRVSSRTMSTAHRNAALMRRFYAEVFNAGNMAAADKFIAEGFVDYTPFPGQAGTRAGLKKGFPQWRAAFPDLRFTVNEVIVQGDKAVARWTARGTHRGVFMGIAPTGKTVQMHGVDIVRIVGGKAVAHWGYGDEAVWMQQIAPTSTAGSAITAPTPVSPPFPVSPPISPATP